MKSTFLIFVFAISSFISFGQNVVSLKLGNLYSGDTVSVEVISASKNIQIVNSDGSVSTEYTITSAFLEVDGINGEGKILADGLLDQNCINMLKQSKGKTVIIYIHYTDTKGIKRTGSFNCYVI